MKDIEKIMQELIGTGDGYIIGKVNAFKKELEANSAKKSLNEKKAAVQQFIASTSDGPLKAYLEQMLVYSPRNAFDYVTVIKLFDDNTDFLGKVYQHIENITKSDRNSKPTSLRGYLDYLFPEENGFFRNLGKGILLALTFPISLPIAAGLYRADGRLNALIDPRVDSNSENFSSSYESGKPSEKRSVLSSHSAHQDKHALLAVANSSVEAKINFLKSQFLENPDWTKLLDKVSKDVKGEKIPDAFKAHEKVVRFCQAAEGSGDGDLQACASFMRSKLTTNLSEAYKAMLMIQQIQKGMPSVAAGVSAGMAKGYLRDAFNSDSDYSASKRNKMS